MLFVEADHLQGAIEMMSGDPKSRSAKKEWHPPELRRLPIAATREGSKKIIGGNEGQGQGKGDTSDEFS